MVLFLAAVVYSRVEGSETTEKTTTPSSSSTQTTSAAAATTQTKTTKAKIVPSDTILTAWLTAGALLILTGAFWGRITSIKAFGAEIGLTKDEANTAAVKAVEKLQKEPKVDTAEALPKVLDKVRTKKKLTGMELDEKEIDRTVDAAVEGLK